MYPPPRASRATITTGMRIKRINNEVDNEATATAAVKKKAIITLCTV